LSPPEKYFFGLSVKLNTSPARTGISLANMERFDRISGSESVLKSMLLLSLTTLALGACTQSGGSSSATSSNSCPKNIQGRYQDDLNETFDFYQNADQVTLEVGGYKISTNGKAIDENGKHASAYCENESVVLVTTFEGRSHSDIWTKTANGLQQKSTAGETSYTSELKRIGDAPPQE
jgi:hypothetical protein